MDFCPHCGEPLAHDVESCPHCGSDFETGWNPDADYYSLELPEDDGLPGQEETMSHSSRSREVNIERILGFLLVFASILVFLWVAVRFHPAGAVPGAALLGACLSFFYFRLRQSQKGS